MTADPTPIAADIQRERLDAISRSIIGGAQRVSNKLGYGFLEKVYENSLIVELEKLGFHIEQQARIQVFYENRVVGDYIPDLLAENSILVEVKAVVALERAHRQQCIHYLRASGHRVCLLLNFGRPMLEVRRLVWNF
jgi:GxxExxY protein